MTLKVSWDEYNALVERLALSVHESGFKFNQIICIARGGLRVGDVLSRIFELPLAILSTHSYTAEGGTIRGELVIAEHMTMTKPRLGERVLLVDDMVDSGKTLEAVYAELPRRFPMITELKDITSESANVAKNPRLNSSAAKTGITISAPIRRAPTI